MNLDYLNTNPWLIMMISALKGDNISYLVDWLIKKSKVKWLLLYNLIFYKT